MSKKVMIGLIALVVAGGLAAAGYGLYRLGIEAGTQGGARAARGAWRADEEIVPRRAEGGPPRDGQGLGRGAWGMGRSPGGRGQWGGMGQAEAPEWTTLEGTVTETSAGQLTLKTPDGEEVTLMLGPEPYWSEQDITIKVGDEIEARVYEDDGTFKVGQITLTATGETLTLRDELGRPLWMDGMGRGPGRGGLGVEQEEQGEASDES
jgi:hypothetical protein